MIYVRKFDMMRMFCMLKQFTTISLYFLISPFLTFHFLFSPFGPGTAESNNKSENTNRIKANSELSLGQKMDLKLKKANGIGRFYRK